MREGKAQRQKRKEGNGAIDAVTECDGIGTPVFRFCYAFRDIQEKNKQNNKDGEPDIMNAKPMEAQKIGKGARKHHGIEKDALSGYDGTCRIKGRNEKQKPRGSKGILQEEIFGGAQQNEGKNESEYVSYFFHVITGGSKSLTCYY